VATYSPDRAWKDRDDRERLLEKLKKKISCSDETSVKNVISNRGYKKYLKVSIGSSLIFEDKVTKKQGIMESCLSTDAEKIFQTLGISTMQKTASII
jgi:hypothetical protein